MLTTLRSLAAGALLLTLGLPTVLAGSQAAAGTATSDVAEPSTEVEVKEDNSGNALTGLSPDEVAIVRRVEAYLNELKTVSSRFLQVSSNGSLAEGHLYLERPGQMRFEYDEPVPIVMIANGVTLLYFDKKLKQATYVPLWKTPLWFLIREEVQLHEDVTITGAEESKGTVLLQLKVDGESLGAKMTLIFADKPLSLRKWEVVDAQGITTQVSLIDPVYDAPIDPARFSTDDLDMKRAPAVRK